MEVLFAVMILTLGMIFVAAQFPMGLATSKQIADSTQGAIDRHNAAVMVDLQLRGILATFGGVGNMIDDRDNTVAFARVHPLATPNFLVDDERLIVDDWEDFGFDIGAPRWPFWSGGITETLWGRYWYVTDPDPTLTNAGDIGHMVCPPVDETDAEVQQILNDWGVAPGDPTYVEDLNNAIFDVAMERNYSWLALYDSDEKMFYVFTCRIPDVPVSYAMQTPESMFVRCTSTVGMNAEPFPYSVWPGGVSNDPAEPMDETDDADRMFPVFWRVFLDDVAKFDGPDGNGPLPGSRWMLEQDGSGLRALEDEDAPDLLYVDAYVAAVLRPGSIIVDADPFDNDGNNTTRTSGDMYEVDDVWMDEIDNMDRYYVRLKSPLRDDLHCFWVVPPAIVDRSVDPPEFADQQPVIDVSIVRMDY